MKKKCSFCKLAQPLASFSVNRSMRDGLQTHCRSCAAARQASPERREWLKEYRKRPEVRAKERAFQREWLSKNPDLTEARRERRRERRRGADGEEGRARDRMSMAKMLAKRRSALATIKDRPCLDCGESFPSYVMDLDHRAGTTKVSSVSQMLASSPWKKIEAEIAKCDVVCANCHRERTHRQLVAMGPRGWGATRGLVGANASVL